MRIGIDANEANIGHKVGVHQYAYEILWSFYRINKRSNKKDQFQIYLKRPPSKDLPDETDWWTYKILSGRGMWILTRLTPHLVFSRDLDVFFTPSHYLPLLSNVPKVFTVHDLGYLEFSEQFNKKDYYQLKHWTAKSLSIANKVVAVSNSTKNDIIKHYKIDPNKIKVVYHGYDKKRFNHKQDRSSDQSVLDKYNINNNYLLFLGTLKPSKNISGLVQAYYGIDQKYKKKYDLVIAGMKGWLYEEVFNIVKDLGLQDQVIFTGYVDENDKEVLYRRAKALLQPSYWEGFGMQVLDSMAVGTPVVISDVASLPEVGGDAAVYVYPNEVQSITDGIEKVLGMTEVQYNKLVQEGLEQVKKFSWDKSGKETLKVIKGVHEDRK